MIFFIYHASINILPYLTDDCKIMNITFNDDKFDIVQLFMYSSEINSFWRCCGSYNLSFSFEADVFWVIWLGGRMIHGTFINFNRLKMEICYRCWYFLLPTACMHSVNSQIADPHEQMRLIFPYKINRSLDFSQLACVTSSDHDFYPISYWHTMSFHSNSFALSALACTCKKHT